MDGNKNFILLLVFGGVLAVGVLGYAVYAIIFPGNGDVAELTLEDVVKADNVASVLYNKYPNALIDYANADKTEISVITFKRCKTEYNCSGENNFERRLYIRFDIEENERNYELVCDETSSTNNLLIFDYSQSVDMLSAINSNECFK